MKSKIVAVVVALASCGALAAGVVEGGMKAREGKAPAVDPIIIKNAETALRKPSNQVLTRLLNGGAVASIDVKTLAQRLTKSQAVLVVSYDNAKTYITGQKINPVVERGVKALFDQIENKDVLGVNGDKEGWSDIGRERMARVLDKMVGMSGSLDDIAAVNEMIQKNDAAVAEETWQQYLKDHPDADKTKEQEIKAAAPKIGTIENLVEKCAPKAANG